MNKAKEAVSGFLNRDGKHDTTVHETINPAITKEHVTRTQHEEQQTAIDREVHQDHHHTSIQPVKDREVLPEQHSHNMAGVEHRNIQHGNDSHLKERLASEAAQFKDTRTVGDTQHTQSAGSTIAGEHVHHHVHENIQPVVQKETIQPSVVHTTVPIHEIHQNEAKHHTATQLPAVSMSEFQSQGGHLGGREVREDSFQGEPKSVGGTLGGRGADGSTSLTESEGRHGHGHSHGNTTGLAHGATTGHNTTSGPHNSNAMNKADPRVDSDRDGSRTMGNTSTTGGVGGVGGTHSSHTTGGNNYSSTSGPHNSNAMNKADPRVDSDRDGSRTMGNTSTTGGVGGVGGTHSSHTTGGNNYSTTTGGTGVGASGIGSGSSAPRTTGTGVGHNTSSNVSGTSHAEHGKKPSLMDKLNPMVDSNGDGKAGFMK